MTIKAMMLMLAEADKQQKGCKIEFFCTSSPATLFSSRVEGRIVYGWDEKSKYFIGESRMIECLFELAM
jgi:hypothetical protein